MRVRVAVVAAVLGMMPAAASAEEPPTDRATTAIERARAKVLDPRYQRELPGYEESEAGTGSGAGRGSGALDPAGKRARERRVPRTRMPRDGAPSIDTRDRRQEDQGALGTLLNTLMWGCVIVGAALLAAWLARELGKYTEDAKLAPDERDAAVASATAAIIERPLGDADDLAARGEYATAIHTLLLRTLHELARSAMVRVERSHTSREILARVPLLADARDALGGLITAVEVTHFGDEPATADDYQRCRQQFHRFAEAFRSGLALQQRAMPRTAAG